MTLCDTGFGKQEGRATSSLSESCGQEPTFSFGVTVSSRFFGKGVTGGFALSGSPQDRRGPSRVWMCQNGRYLCSSHILLPSSTLPPAVRCVRASIKVPRFRCSFARILASTRRWTC